MIKLKEIEQIINAYLEGSDKYLVHSEVKPGNKIFVYIDGDKGVTIDDCVSLSRQIESQFDREKEDFEWNVSSPGADQPLKLKRQYLKNTGRSLKLKLTEEKQLTGKLVEAGEEGINILPEPDKKKKKESPKPVFIPYEEIIEARVIISFK
jgi:ribosome maturation factor RimP